MSGCSPTWTSHDDTNIPDGVSSAANTIQDCQNECNFNSLCIAVDWVGTEATGQQCWIHGTSSVGRSTASSRGTQHHAISRKCGQYCYCIPFRDFYSGVTRRRGGRGRGRGGGGGWRGRWGGGGRGRGRRRRSMNRRRIVLSYTKGL